MAYFGRKVKKPGSKPGAASGFAQQRTVRVVRAAVERLAERTRAGRPARAGKAVRAARAGRSGRSAR